MKNDIYEYCKVKIVPNYTFLFCCDTCSVQIEIYDTSLNFKLEVKFDWADVKLRQMLFISMEQKEHEYQNQNILGNDVNVEITDLVSTDEEVPHLKKYVILSCLDVEVAECVECHLPHKPKYSVTNNNASFYICTDECLNSFKKKHKNEIVSGPESNLRVKNLLANASNNNIAAEIKCERNCGECSKNISHMERNLSWQVMEFCNQSCLGKHQKRKYSNCTSCKAEIDFTCLGKYCVRFGYETRQFCGNNCLQEYKSNLRVYSYCQKNITGGDGGFMVPVGGQVHYKDFCTENCNKKYTLMYGKQSASTPGVVCVVCNCEKNISIEFEHDNKTNLFCGDSCFAAFKFANDIVTGKCDLCQKHYNIEQLKYNSIYYENLYHAFCSESCKNIYLMVSKKIVSCKQCKANKYNFDMIQCKIGNGGELAMCSLNCLSIYREPSTGVNSTRMKCSYCLKDLQPIQHDTVDVTVRTFCSYMCLISFQNQYLTTFTSLTESSQPSTSAPVKASIEARNKFTEKPESSVGKEPNPLAITNKQYSASTSQTTARNTTEVQNMVEKISSQSVREYMKPMATQRNVATMCKVTGHDKSVHCKPTTADKQIQTDKLQEGLAILPIPVPIYVPLPICKYSLPFPVPFPIPLPIPVPIFIPTTCKTASGIMREIKSIKEKIPADPLEAELIIMAKMAADDVQTKDPMDIQGESAEEISDPELDDTPPTELNKSKVLVESPKDLENVVIPSTSSTLCGSKEGTTDKHHPAHQPMEIQNSTQPKRSGDSPNTAKKKQKTDSVKEIKASTTISQPQPSELNVKDNAQMCLMYKLGINVWNQWLLRRNAQFEKSSPPVKLLKSEILQFTVDELNYALCLFVKEVRKPNGLEYSPDTIYYLCLCVQMYLFKNERVDNIFYDTYYEKFTECLDEVAKKFSLLYKDRDYIVTRVREDHLWECKQLGAHCPYVLLNSIMFFNTGYFNLETIDDHMQLSFLKAMKHWKGKFKESGENKITAQKDLRIDENSFREYPKRLYEFYLSKCPESAKTRSDVFYLLPERCCALDSPVWFSTTPFPQNTLQKMLHRIKMVKEINAALLFN